MSDQTPVLDLALDLGLTSISAMTRKPPRRRRSRTRRTRAQVVTKVQAARLQPFSTAAVETLALPCAGRGVGADVRALGHTVPSGRRLSFIQPCALMLYRGA